MFSGVALGGGGFGEIQAARTYRSAFNVTGAFSSDASVIQRDIGGFRAISLYLEVVNGVFTDPVQLELGWVFDNQSTDPFLVVRRDTTTPGLLVSDIVTLPTIPALNTGRWIVEIANPGAAIGYRIRAQSANPAQLTIKFTGSS
jgi:hypothetical protein